MEPEVVHEMLDSIEQLVDLADPGLLGPEMVKEIFERLAKKLEEMAEAKTERRKTMAHGDFDDEDKEQMAEEDEMDEEVMKQARSPPHVHLHILLTVPSLAAVRGLLYAVRGLLLYEACCCTRLAAVRDLLLYERLVAVRGLLHAVRGGHEASTPTACARVVPVHCYYLS